MLRLPDLISEVQSLRARGIEPEQLARWLERRGYAQVYAATVLMRALAIDSHEAARAVCASGTWTSRTVELTHVERRLALACERSASTPPPLARVEPSQAKSV